MASALIELSGYVNDDLKEKYFQHAEIMMNSLSGPEYRAKKGQNGCFILKHCVGHLTADSYVDVPLVYADYYYFEALMRYLRCGGG